MTGLALPVPRSPRPAGWWGMALFVATEATLFGAIFGTYFYLRSNAVHWPPRGIDAPDPVLPLVLAVVLASSSLLLRRAVAAAAAGRLGRARIAIVLAVAVQCAYLATHLVLFAHDLDRFQPAGSAYASVYYLMLGAHDAHVAAGLLLELWVVARLVSGLTRYRFVALQATALYWHFVNVLALLVAAVEISAAL